MDLSEDTTIGKIKAITKSMEFSFEMKIEDLNSVKVDTGKTVLDIGFCFFLSLKQSAESSKYYINHWQFNGLGKHDEILKSNPISVSNHWKKEFLEIILKNQ